MSAKAAPVIEATTKYERARLIGSRALQISQGAPLLIKMTKKQLEVAQYNPIEIAKLEHEKGVIPIGVRRIMPNDK